MSRRALLRFVLPYALAMAVAAVLLEWLRFRHVTRIDSTELYVAILAIGFIALGIWVGRKLTPRPRAAAFERNEAAIRSLGRHRASARSWSCSPRASPTRSWRARSASRPIR